MREHLRRRHATYGAVLSLYGIYGPERESLKGELTELQAFRAFLEFDDLVAHLNEFIGYIWVWYGEDGSLKRRHRRYR